MNVARVKLVVAWVLVGAPLLFGLFVTLSTVPALFTGH
ncbi:MFS transporter small subunit [Psychromicrobium xiongbiense]